MRSYSFVLVVLTLSLASFTGCGDDATPTEEEHHHHDDEDGGTDEHEHDSGLEGVETGSICPSNSTLTYETFGQDFMESYCVRCHDSQKTGDARMNAPLEHDFDTLEGVMLVADHIDEFAAAGPDAINEVMPPDGDKPSIAERRQLGEWLACGAP